MSTTTTYPAVTRRPVGQRRLARRLRSLALAAESCPPDEGWGNDAHQDDAPPRFLLIEQSTRESGRYWFTTDDDPCALLDYHDNQEYAGDWWAVGIYDLDTREEVTVERRYTVTGRTPGGIE
jgi:hypothetical protein